MPLLELQIPEEIDDAINSVSTDKNGFILDALKQKLHETKNRLIEEKLIEGYKSNHNENLSLMEDFKEADLKNWNEY
jgi:hypothetical protein